jgi:hypothetical protein
MIIRLPQSFLPFQPHEHEHEHELVALLETWQVRLPVDTTIPIPIGFPLKQFATLYSVPPAKQKAALSFRASRLGLGKGDKLSSVFKVPCLLPSNLTMKPLSSFLLFSFSFHNPCLDEIQTFYAFFMHPI